MGNNDDNEKLNIYYGLGNGTLWHVKYTQLILFYIVFSPMHFKWLRRSTSLQVKFESLLH